MRDFNDKDRTKKATRIKLGDNPANLSPEALTRLESEVKDALKDGHLSCPVGWKIAQKMGIPKVAVGAVMDRLGVRISNCQLGFFRIDKTQGPEDGAREPHPQIAVSLKELDEAHKLTCAAVFELARTLGTTPALISKTANNLKIKISTCQLGCF
jgi:hypothetical protein